MYVSSLGSKATSSQWMAELCAATPSIQLRAAIWNTTKAAHDKRENRPSLLLARGDAGYLVALLLLPWAVSATLGGSAAPESEAASNGFDNRIFLL